MGWIGALLSPFFFRRNMLEQLASDIAGSVKNSDYKVDPITILTIISIIVSVWRNCKPTQARINNPSFLDRWRLRRMVRAQFNKTSTPNKKHYNEIYQALINKASTLSVEQVKKIEQNISNQIR